MKPQDKEVDGILSLLGARIMGKEYPIEKAYKEAKTQLNRHYRKKITDEILEKMPEPKSSN